MRSLRPLAAILPLLLLSVASWGQVLLQGSTSRNIQPTFIDATTHIAGKTGLLTGQTITATGGSTTTITTASNTNLAVGEQVVGATGTAGNIGQKTWITAISGAGPYTLTVAPALPNSPANTDTFTASQFLFQLSKNGAAFAPPTGTIAENAYGNYVFSPSAADVGTLHSLKIHYEGVGTYSTAIDPGDPEFWVVAYDSADAVRLGLTALPNFAAGAVGGLGVLDANSLLDVDVKRWLAVAPASVTTNGFVKTALQRWLTDDAGGTPNALSSGRPDVSVGAYPGNTPQTGDAFARLGLNGAGLTAIPDSAGVGTLLSRLGLPIGATISADIAGIAAGVWTVGTRQLTAAQTFNLTGNITGNLSGSVGSVTNPVSTTYSLKKNTSYANFAFTMTTAAGAYATGLTVTAQRSLDGAAFASTTNSPTALGNGVYLISLSAADLNANTVVLRFSATGARDTILVIITQQ